MSNRENPYIHIKEYLDYYLSMSVPPNYAVMIRGAWGSGKSWFVKKYFKEHTDMEYLYVSLYGITSYKEIQEEFYRQIHPILSSKGMKLLGTIGKGLLKATLKIDLYGDSKDDGTYSPTIPQVDLPEHLKSLGNRVLVFDDLERCSIPIHNILGYINQFVENDGMKVIVIANEIEIIKKDNVSPDSEKYILIKEKLFGKSFDIKPSFDSAFDKFISEVKNEVVKELLKNNSFIVADIFNAAGYNNLRHVRQSILDFDKFFMYLPEEGVRNKGLVEQLIKVFFSLSFELKKGYIVESEISNIYSLVRSNKVAELSKKYSFFDIVDTVITSNLLGSFFVNSSMDKKAVRESILNSRYLEVEYKPEWMKLWYFSILEDNEFKTLRDSVFESLKSLKIERIHELLHVVSIFLALADRKLSPYKKEDIIEIGKLNVENLKTAGLLQVYKKERLQIDSSYGLEYQGISSRWFQDFIDYVQKQIDLLEYKYPFDVSVEILDTLSSSIDDFEKKITLKNSHLSKYYDVPILKSIPLKDFLNVFFKLANGDKKRLGWILQDRYSHYEYNAVLKLELEWLKDVRNAIDLHIKDKEMTISIFIITSSFFKALDSAIQSLENS